MNIAVPDDLGRLDRAELLQLQGQALELASRALEELRRLEDVADDRPAWARKLAGALDARRGFKPISGTAFVAAVLFVMLFSIGQLAPACTSFVHSVQDAHHRIRQDNTAP